MNMYEVTVEKFERCVRMSKYYISINEINLAVFWKNAAEGFYKKLLESTVVDLVA
ncbi:MAG: hypothetical protein MJ174_05075 [Treponema sp.]|nr:hypothetical protein [Treponema sp.]